MSSEIVVIHLEKNRNSAGPDLQLSPVDWIKWETCLRVVYFGVAANLPANLDSTAEVYRGRDAYYFCLHTVCGLKSPMLGETEVWGQFKGLFRDFDFASVAFGKDLQKFVSSLFADGKLIRHTHLTGLGSQSYGSLARRLLRGLDEVNFIGAGSLVEQMLPWLVKGRKKVRLFCRRREQGVRRLEELKVLPEQVEIVQLTSGTHHEIRGGLIVAAPISADIIGTSFSGRQLEKVVDLREDSTKDRLEMDCQVIALVDFFNEIESTRSAVAEKVIAAERDIRLLADKQFNHGFRRAGCDELWL